jgi:hypothetical protein
MSKYILRVRVHPESWNNNFGKTYYYSGWAQGTDEYSPLVNEGVNHPFTPWRQGAVQLTKTQVETIKPQFQEHMAKIYGTTIKVQDVKIARSNRAAWRGY